VIFKTKIFWFYLSLALVPIVMDIFWPRGFPWSPGREVLRFVPTPLYIALGLAGFLGWQLNQTRILIATVLFLGTVYLTFPGGIFLAWDAGPKELSQIFSMALPISLMLVFRLKESRFNEIQNLSKLAIALAPVALFMYWGLGVTRDFRQLASWELVKIPLALHIPQFSLLCLFLFLGGIWTIKDKKIKPFIIATAISMLPFMSLVRANQMHPAPGYDPTFHNLIAFTAICIIQLHAIFKMYWQRVYIDELTEISNRRALDEYLHKLNGEYAIAMIDIDHFKAFNDTYGHDEGDNVLRMVAQALDEELGNKVYRYGGEEFCAVFEGVAGEDAYMFANKVRRKLEDREFIIRKSSSKRNPSTEKERGKAKRRKKAQVTISVGLASPENGHQTPQDVIILADQALYSAKDEGRNCVIIWAANQENGKKTKKKK